MAVVSSRVRNAEIYLEELKASVEQNDPGRVLDALGRMIPEFGPASTGTG